MLAVNIEFLISTTKLKSKLICVMHTFSCSTSPKRQLLYLKSTSYFSSCEHKNVFFMNYVQLASINKEQHTSIMQWNNTNPYCVNSQKNTTRNSSKTASFIENMYANCHCVCISHCKQYTLLLVVSKQRHMYGYLKLFLE